MTSWTPKDYTPFFLIDEPTHKEREIRKEYSRVRDIMMKRAARLEKQGLTPQAQYIRETMPKLSAVKGSVSSRLAQGMALYNQRSYSLSGVKLLQKMIQAETGEIVPLGEVLSFNEFMKSWRMSAFSRLVVPSGEAAALYGDEYQDVGGSFSDFYTLYKEM